MILTVPLQAGTVLANVAYRTIVAGVASAPITIGITQPDILFPDFRIDIGVPNPNTEEVIVYDSTDLGNWNVAGYPEAVFGLGPTAVSPNLAQLKILCGYYLDVDPTDFTFNGVDMFLVAANDARRGAEQKHNFEYARVVASLLIDGNRGGNLDDAVDPGTLIDNPPLNPAQPFWPSYIQKFKEIVAARRLRPNGTYIPLDFTRADIPIERERTELEYSDNLWPTFRYPSDADLRARGTASTLIQRGKTVFIYPGFVDAVDNQVTITLEGYGWLRSYGSIGIVSQPEDFFVEFGYEYLKWFIICQLNKKFKSYVARQEGNLPEPQKELDNAWNELLVWDSYQVDSNVTRSR